MYVIVVTETEIFDDVPDRYFSMRAYGPFENDETAKKIMDEEVKKKVRESKREGTFSKVIEKLFGNAVVVETFTKSGRAEKIDTEFRYVAVVPKH